MTQLIQYATASSRTVAAMIHATPIRRDAEGRYCLNDLHKAAGGEHRQQPHYFMALESTKELAEAISNSRLSGNKNPVEMSRGRYGGTYVHEDIAIDYAAWVSPVFKLEVYRAFKETRSEKTTAVGDSLVPAGTSLSSLLRMAMEAAEEKERLEAELAAAQPRIDFSNAVEADESTRCIRETAKQFGLSDQRLTEFLVGRKVLYRVKHPKDSQAQVLPYQQFIDDGSFVVRTHAVAAGYVRSRTHVTGKGLLRIHRMLTAN